jgi:hypothetical protein
MGWEELVARMVKNENAFKVLVENTERKSTWKIYT